MTPFYDDDHEAFRATVRQFVAREVVPNVAKWDEARLVDRDLFTKAGSAGLLGTAVPEEYGGGGADDFRFNLVIDEEFARVGANAAGLSLSLHNDIVLPYLLASATAEQKERWLPGCVSGEIVTAIAMTEPDAGSDLGGIGTTAVRDGAVYVVNGTKTFITNGIHADLVVTAVKTDPTERHRGLEPRRARTRDAGFHRPTKLDKIGLDAQDTAELLFVDVAVPVENLLGVEGEGFFSLVHNLPQERLSIAADAISAAEYALDLTVDVLQRSCGIREAHQHPAEHPLHPRRGPDPDRSGSSLRARMRAAAQCGAADRRTGGDGEVVVHRDEQALSSTSASSSMAVTATCVSIRSPRPISTRG